MSLLGLNVGQHAATLKHLQAVRRHGLRPDPTLSPDGVAIILPEEDAAP